MNDFTSLKEKAAMAAAVIGTGSFVALVIGLTAHGERAGDQEIKRMREARERIGATVTEVATGPNSPCDVEEFDDGRLRVVTLPDGRRVVAKATGANPRANHLYYNPNVDASFVRLISDETVDETWAFIGDTSSSTPDNSTSVANFMEANGVHREGSGNATVDAERIIDDALSPCIV